MIVGGATGALVLSITFLRNLGSVAGLLASEWLVCAWVLLLLALLLSLLSNYTSAKSFDVEISLRLEAWLHGGKRPANQWPGPHSVVRPDHARRQHGVATVNAESGCLKVVETARTPDRAY